MTISETTVNGTLNTVTLISALGCGLVAGVFWAFSTFVMKALAAMPPEQGAAAMRWINVAVLNPWFLTPFVGTAVTSILLVVASLLRWQDPRAGYWLVGGVLYFAGTFLVTMLFNVPRNDALAAAVPWSSEAYALWKDYLTSWTAWNHVRTGAALAAAAVLTVAFAARV